MQRNKRPVLFVLISLLLATLPLTPLGAQTTTTTTFSGGSSQVTVDLNNGTNTSVGFDLTRNTTITSASMFIQPNINTASPGQLSMDINMDGQPEWAFDQPGYGDFGHQQRFSNGNHTASMQHPAYSSLNGMPTPNLLLPEGTTVASAQVNVSFIPTVPSGFHVLGHIIDVEVGELNNNTGEDVVLLGQAPNSTTHNRSLRTMEWTGLTGLHTTNWSTTCNNATEIMLADLNADDHDDVIAHVPSSSQLCIHFYNSTSQQLNPSVNITLSSAIRAFAFGDMNGNGADDMVTVRSAGLVTYERFNNRTNVFTSYDTVTVYEDGSLIDTANLQGVFVERFEGPGTNYTAIAVDFSNTGAQLVYNSNGITVTPGYLNGLSTNAVCGDFDNDGDLDFISETAGGHRSIENRFGVNSWNGDNHNGALVFTNATILDHDQNFAASFFMPKFVNADGNSATVEGNFSYHRFRMDNNNQNRVDLRVQGTDLLVPWTAPRSLDVADIDGDGISEHLVVAGEGVDLGLFVSAWHRIGLDVDKNGDEDLVTQGYSGNGSLGVNPLTVEDPLGNLTGLLNSVASTWQGNADGYGNTMAPVNMSVNTQADGMFHFSNLNIQYQSDFLIDTNPFFTGNLTNVLNQMMTLGNGDFTVPMTFTGTHNGSFNIHTPTLTSVPGAANLALPPTPLVQATSIQPQEVVLEWQNLSDFGDDLIEFFVYRSNTSTLASQATPYANTPTNLTIDANIQPGETWWYWVKSLHNYGVTSNISSPVQVTVPFPLPQSYVPEVTAADRPNDTGGALVVAWGDGHPSLVEHHVYLSTSNFSSLDGMTPASIENATARSTVLFADANTTSLMDGVGYYVAVVGVDAYGNFSSEVAPIGPEYTRNDTYLPTNLALNFSGFTSDSTLSSLLLKRDGELSLIATLTQNGTGLAGQEVVFYIRGNGENYSLPAFTNDDGVADASLSRLSSIGPITAEGPMEIEVFYPGSNGNELQQPLAPASQTVDAFGVVEITIDHDDVIQLDDVLAFSAVFTVEATNPAQSASVANLVATHRVLDADGNEISNGTTEVRGNTMTVEGIAPYDGTLELHLNTSVPMFYVPGMHLSVPFEASPNTGPSNQTNNTEPGTNGTNTTTGSWTLPEATLPATVDCGTATYEWDSNATDVQITCTVTNPNPFDVTVGLAWQTVPATPPAIEVVHNEADGTTPSLTAEANGTVDLTFSLVRNGPTEGMFPGLQGEGYNISLTCLDFGDNACDTMTEDTAYTEGEIVWTLGEMPLDNVAPTDPQDDDASSSTTPIVVGLGLFLMVTALVGGVLVLRQRRGAELFEEDEDDDYMAGFPTNDAEPETLDLSTSRTLNDLKDDGRNLYEDAPEGAESSSLLSGGADAFVFGATAEHDEGEHDGESESTDDGITVDEEGTEWWEDEEGVWWYREEGWEDWVVWED